MTGSHFSATPPLSRLLTWGLDLVLPPRCPVSGEIVGRCGDLSASAWKDLTFISSPKCNCCGFPFGNEVESTGQEDMLCGACVAFPRPYARARSALVYDDASRNLILAFKHGDKIQLTTSLVPLLERAGADLWDGCEALIPVPLHWRRLLARRYNQSGLLAQGLAKMTGIPYLPDTLIRIHHTPPQGHKNARARHDNVHGVFRVKDKLAETIQDKKVVLIDDVMTTGATLEECTKTLLNAGARDVSVLTIARVLRAE